MELFERVAALAQISDRGKISLAEEIGLNRHTFQGYFSKKRQDNLWPLLPLILAKHPELSREWLYFEEGRMLIADNPDNEKIESMLDELTALRLKEIELEKQIKDLHVALESQKEQMATLNRAIDAQEKVISAYQGIHAESKKGIGIIADSSGIAAHSLHK